MTRPVHVHVPHHRTRGGRPPLPAATLLLLLLLALAAAAWIDIPPVASLLPIPAPR